MSVNKPDTMKHIEKTELQRLLDEAWENHQASLYNSSFEKLHCVVSRMLRATPSEPSEVEIQPMARGLGQYAPKKDPTPTMTEPPQAQAEVEPAGIVMARRMGYVFECQLRTLLGDDPGAALTAHSPDGQLADMIDRVEELVTRIEKLEPAENRNPFEEYPWQEISNDANRTHLTDCDIFAIWKIGFSAFHEARKLGAKFPHQ